MPPKPKVVGSNPTGPVYLVSFIIFVCQRNDMIHTLFRRAPGSRSIATMKTTYLLLGFKTFLIFFRARSNNECLLAGSKSNADIGVFLVSLVG